MSDSVTADAYSPASSSGELSGVMQARLATLLREDRLGSGELAITRLRTRLGSSAHCDLVLEGPNLAPIHAELLLQEGVWYLADLGGEAAESWVDGAPVVGTSPVAPGSSIRLGGMHWIFDPVDRWEDSSPLRTSPSETLNASQRYPDEILASDSDSAPPSRLWWLWYFIASLVVIAGAALLILWSR